MANFFSSPWDPSERILSCNKQRGAAMLLLAQSQREDTVAGGEFAEWMVKHIDCWFSFAKRLHPEIERMEDIILVTGCHRTKSWANVAFTDYRGIVHRFPMQASLPIPGNPSARNVWTFNSASQEVALNIAPHGNVRRGLPYTIGKRFNCMDSGPIYGHMRIYPRIPCHSHSPSVELV